MQAAFELGGLVVQGFAALDKKLEEAKVLPKLEATPESPDVVDPATGEVKSEYQRVRHTWSLPEGVDRTAGKSRASSNSCMWSGAPTELVHVCVSHILRVYIWAGVHVMRSIASLVPIGVSEELRCGSLRPMSAGKHGGC
eukprot:scaffold145393_cov19-Tisochrysis_lutea.AAC.5